MDFVEGYYMNYLISENAKYSFSNKPNGCKPPILIDASVAKIRQYWSKTEAGRLFFSHEVRVEKPEKLNKAQNWIANHKDIWAPVIDVRSTDPSRILFADGRHTFVALEKAGYQFIKISVPEDRADELKLLLQCFDIVTYI